MKLGIRTGVLAALLALLGCNAAPAPIEIGHVSDHSRRDKAGLHAELGIRLALSELSKDDALTQAFTGRKVQVRHTNTRGQLDAFESEAVRLDSVSRCVALLGGSSGAEAAALSNAKVPVLTFHGYPVSDASNNVFYLGMMPARQGAVLGKVVAEDAKSDRVAIILDEKRPEAVAAADAFQKTLGGTRKIAMFRYTEDPNAPRIVEDAKWHDLTESVLRHNPHTVMFAGAVQEFNAWHKVLRKDFPDAKAQLVFAGADGAHRLFELDGDKTEVMLATAFFADPASEKITTFMKAYHDAFGKDQEKDADVNAALAYDGLRILIEAMKQTPSDLKAEKLRDELLKTKDFPGLTGPLTINADRQVQRPLFVVRWQNGVLTKVKMFPAE